MATGCAALVLALGIFAASPALHSQLHHGVDAAADDSCAIVLFANGVSVPLAVVAPPRPAAEWREQAYLRSADILLDSPRYLLLPGRGPPAA